MNLTGTLRKLLNLMEKQLKPTFSGVYISSIKITRLYSVKFSWSEFFGDLHSSDGHPLAHFQRLLERWRVLKLKRTIRSLKAKECILNQRPFFLTKWFSQRFFPTNKISFQLHVSLPQNRTTSEVEYVNRPINDNQLVSNKKTHATPTHFLFQNTKGFSTWKLF